MERKGCVYMCRVGGGHVETDMQVLEFCGIWKSINNVIETEVGNVT